MLHIFCLGNAVPEHGFRPFKNYSAPGGVLHRNFRVIHGGFLRKPVVITRYAAYVLIKLEHSLLKLGIVSARAESFRKLAKIRVVFRVCVFKSFLDCGGGNRGFFLLVHGAKIRRKPKGTEAFPHNVKAEGGYGRNMSTFHQKLLAAQAPVVGALLNKLRKGGVYAGFHFRRRQIRKSNSQNAVCVHRIFLPGEHTDYALHQNRGFAAACGGGNKQVAAECGNRFKLLFVPFTLCHSRRLLRFFYKIRPA